MSALEKHLVKDDILFTNHIGNSSGGHGVLPFHIGRTWFKLAVTSSNCFLPVDAHDK